MKATFGWVLLAVVIYSSCAQKLAAVPADDRPIAFPGAEGFGKYTTGGRGGKVQIVTNLNDDGEGSLRNALKIKEPAIIVFEVSGNIHLKKPLHIPANTTIAGHSAPGDGICIADQSVILNGDNIILRYLRIRLGDRHQNAGMQHGGGDDDALGGHRRKNIIIDHCSLSWSTDEVFTVYNGDSTSLQWNIISEPLNYSYHFETGDKDFELHGFGGIWGGKHLSGHHNLFAHCNNRTPRFNGIRQQPEEFVDFRNNVIYNWGNNNVYAGEGGRYNVINNYYKYGPSTRRKARFSIVNPYKKEPEIPFGKYYIDGNYVDESPAVTNNNWLGVTMNDGDESDAAIAKVAAPFPVVPVTTQPATEAYELVLKHAGASHKRDTLDERLVNDVKNRTGKIIDVQGGLPHGTPYEQTIHAWPKLKSISPQKDTDRDGMPDEWEKRNNLNPNDSSDASAYGDSKTYTNIEIYLNSLLNFNNEKK